MENYGTLILDYYPIFSFVDVIESYEGPTLIRLTKESTKEEYVAKWCEQTGNLERWLIVRADSELITDYCLRKINMLTLLSKLSNEIGFLYDVKRDNNDFSKPSFVYQIKFDQLLDDKRRYLPTDVWFENWK